MEYCVMMVDGVWCVISIVSRESSEEAAKAVLREVLMLDGASKRIREAAFEMTPSEMAHFLDDMPSRGDRTPESIEAWLETLPRAPKH